MMKNRMNICHVDLRPTQTTKTTTNKTKTIQDYLGGSSVELMSYFQENAFVCCMHSG
jgi:hypothetical protein